VDWKTTVKNYVQHLEKNNRSANTIRCYQKDWRLFEAFYVNRYGSTPMLNAITSEQIEQFLHESQHVRGNQPSTLQRQYYALSSLFAFAYSEKIIERNVALSVNRVQAEKKEPEWLSEDEMKQVAHAISHPIIRMIVIFLFYSGLRISEALSLKLEDVDLDKRTIFVRQGKGGKSRTVPLLPLLIPIVEQYLKNDRPKIESTFFFGTERTGRVSDVYVNRHIQRAVKKLGWNKKLSAHQLRHSYASYMLKQHPGIHLVHLKKLLGHESLASTGIYTLFSPLEKLDTKSVFLLHL
jgi:integrase/recombinase XerD